MTTTIPTTVKHAPTEQRLTALFDGKQSNGNQRNYIDRLEAKALLTPDDYMTYQERLATALGFTETVTYEDDRSFTYADETACKRVWESRLNHREHVTSAVASVMIEVLKQMAGESRCEGYCRERGVRHGMVRYYDDHYDYECGLS